MAFTSIGIFWNDLKEEKQKKIMELLEQCGMADHNWDDIHPMAYLDIK